MPYAIKRVRFLEKYLGEKFVYCVVNETLGDDVLQYFDVAPLCLGDAISVIRSLRDNDVLIIEGGGLARYLAASPSCFKVMYAHDDPSVRSIQDNTWAVGWFRPDVLFAKQQGRLAFYKTKVKRAEWVCYGVDTDIFHPMPEVPVEYGVVLASGKESIYAHRFEWMQRLAEKVKARVETGLSYADYARLLASARVLPDIPNRRQMGNSAEWRLSVNYRVFEALAMGKPTLAPDLPGYRNVLGDLVTYYELNYACFEAAVLAALGTEHDVVRGLEAMRENFSLEAVTRHEANVISEVFN